MSGSGVGWYLCQIFTKFSDNDDNEYSTQLQMRCYTTVLPNTPKILSNKSYKVDKVSSVRCSTGWKIIEAKRVEHLFLNYLLTPIHFTSNLPCWSRYLKLEGQTRKTTFYADFLRHQTPDQIAAE